MAATSKETETETAVIAAPNLSSLHDSASLRVLVVEDDITSLHALCAILKRHGYDVVPAKRLSEASRLLTSDYAAVVLDLMLPDGDGIEILRRIRDEGLSTKVVVTTALTEDDRLQPVRALAPERIIKKPVDLAALLRALRGA